MKRDPLEVGWDEASQAYFLAAVSPFCRVL
jgi:hypothetical protein